MANAGLDRPQQKVDLAMMLIPKAQAHLAPPPQAQAKGRIQQAPGAATPNRGRGTYAPSAATPRKPKTRQSQGTEAVGARSQSRVAQSVGS